MIPRIEILGQLADNHKILWFKNKWIQNIVEIFDNFLDLWSEFVLGLDDIRGQIWFSLVIPAQVEILVKQ